MTQSVIVAIVDVDARSDGVAALDVRRTGALHIYKEA
jgi:hypothetical protein